MNIAEVLSGRAGLAGVQWALLARPGRHVLRAELGAMLAGGSSPGPCRLRRAKFKPERKLTAYYATAIRSQDGCAFPSRPIAVTWTPQTNVSGEPSPELLAMEQDALERGLGFPFRRLTAGVASWGLRLHVSPLDTAFPQLLRLSDPRYVCEMLATLYETASDHPAQPSPGPAARYTITPVRYRPGQRHVLRYEPAKGDNGVIFAKLYKGGNGARFCQAAVRVADWLATSGESGEAGITAVRPQAYIAADDVILYPRVAGRPLSWYLRRAPRTASVSHEASVARSLQRAGTLLRALHEAPAGVAAGLERHDFTVGLKLIARASEHIQVLLPSTAAKITAVLERAQALHARLPQESPALAHGDFKADHLWVTRAGLTLIDLDDCCLADPALDLGKFLADLHWWYTLSGRPGLERAQSQFLDGYGLELPAERLVRARLYELLWLVKITVRRARLFDRDWAQRTTQLIGRASAAFERLQAQTASRYGV